MGLDVGDRTVGVAISDPTRTIAQGVTTVRRTSTPKDLDALCALIEEHQVTALVVGWPLMLNGRPGSQARKVGRFADALAERTGLPIARWDERLTTKAAERALLEGNVRRDRRRQVVDKVAATLILQSYLDAPPKDA
jgi:putative Holliday junction resolvase